MDLLPTFKDDSPLLQEIGRWAYLTYHERDMIQVYLHLIFSALFPIYIGAHASLYRPPSAKSAKKSRKDEGISEDEDDDEIEVKPMAEGLQPSDAILFPVMAGLTLGGLYLIIKWLNDPAILNRILGYYFSALGVFGVGKLAADALNVGTSFIFPSVWSDGTETYHIDPRISRQVAGHVQKARKSSTRQGVEGKSNPFPGYLSKVGFPKTWSKLQWSIRALLKDRWTFTGYVHGVVEIKYKIRLNDVIGFILGLGTILLYNTVGKTWWLTNLIAFGFCYGTFQLLSPTTFWTGSLVLAGLFVYDIVMVFYTPMMVTVATTLDVPIKLVFPGPTRESMLGLGDVVLPGLMIALALRFDLYLHYLSLQKTIPAISPSLSPFTSHPENRTPGSPRTEKATYVEAGGKWGERFWTRKRGRNAEIEHPDLKKVDDEKTIADAARFDKVYFKAGLVGYVVGMIVTLMVLIFWEHAQPALLYLVPGVLISLWGTAWVRGDWRLMWEYTEDGSLDGEDERKKDWGNGKLTANGKGGKAEEKANGLGVQGVEKMDQIDNEKRKESNSGTKESEGKSKDRHDYEHHVFLLSLSAPKSRSSRKAN